MKKYGFSVDHFSDDVTCRKILLKLKRTIRLGKLAQDALREIETTGFTERMLPVSGERNDSSWDNQSKKYCKSHNVQLVRFRKREDISRADLGPMDQIHIELGKMVEGKYSVFVNKETDLTIHGPFRRQIDAQGTLETQELSVKIGFVRINKSHLSFVENGYGGATHQVYKSLKVSQHAAASYKAMANCIAKAIIGVSNERVVDPVTGVISGKEIDMSAKVHDLQAAAPQWLVDDGHIERICNEIHQTVKVLTVMEA